jgi:hypothetical protein
MCTNVSVAPVASTTRANDNLEKAKFSVRITGDQAETRSDHLRNTSHKHTGKGEFHSRRGHEDSEG